MGPYDISDLPADGQRRVERALRILEHHGDVAAANGAHAGLVDAKQILPVEHHAPAGGARRRAEQAHHRKHAQALAGAGFADDADSLSCRDGEIDAADSLDDAARRVAKANAKALDTEQGPVHATSVLASLRGSNSSRTASPSRLKPITVIEIASPGNTGSHHSPE